MSNGQMESYDVVVIGGGPAGLNGALMLARSRRSVLVIDAGSPRNSPAHGVHGLLGHDGTPPRELLERGRGEVTRYGGRVVSGQVTAASRNEDTFTVRLDGETSVRARRLLVTTGAVDQLPDLPGVQELWGRDVLHCPYCHGYEVRDKAIGILASGPRSLHQALLFRQLSDDVVYFSHGLPPNQEELEQLSARAIRIVDGEVASLDIVADRLAGVRMRDDTMIEREALVIAPRLVIGTDFLADLGLQAAEHPSGMGQHLEVDHTGRTDVAGVWAAGNVTDPAAQVGSSAAAGAQAGAQINADLAGEDTRRAVEERKGLSPAAS